jgi:Glycosyl hydrolase family 9
MSDIVIISNQNSSIVIAERSVNSNIVLADKNIVVITGPSPVSSTPIESFVLLPSNATLTLAPPSVPIVFTSNIVNTVIAKSPPSANIILSLSASVVFTSNISAPINLTPPSANIILTGIASTVTVGVPQPSAVFVSEITMAAPDLVRVEIRDPDVQYGTIVPLIPPYNTPTPAQYTWIQNAGKWGMTIGPPNTVFRTEDVGFAKLNRPSVDVAAGYGTIGSRNVIAVYRNSVPRVYGSTHSTRVFAFNHFVYLKLDGALAAGSHTITFPSASTLPPKSFVFNDKVTRLCSIRSTQLGHKTSDVSKYAYLALWLPGGPGDGAVDFRTYGLTTFSVIDAAGTVVFSGPITLRVGPFDPEPGAGTGFNQPLLLTYTRADGTTYQANRAGTFVFGLDYSAWGGATPGLYRLYISGLGVSDAFQINDTIWNQAAQVYWAGLYHWHRSMPLDGRFGYTRPDGFSDTAGTVILQSNLPLALDDQGGGGFVNFGFGPKAPWVTTEVVTDTDGGYHDAGDWDDNAAHMMSSYMFLDLYEHLPVAKRTVSYNMPAAKDILRDPMYAGKTFPNLINEAIWNIDHFRRMQTASGGVRGAVDMSTSPRHFEPSWLTTLPLYVCAPDLVSSYFYVVCAIKLVIALRSIGENTIADVFEASAMRAWDWAEIQRADPNLGMSNARTIMGLTDAAFQAKLISGGVVSRSNSTHGRAAVMLYRLTGLDSYHTMAKAWLTSPGPNRLDPENFEYFNNIPWPNVDTALQATCKNNYLVYVNNQISYPTRSQDSYLNFKDLVSTPDFGPGNAPTTFVTMALYHCHRMTGLTKYLKTMQDGSAHVLGANQVSLSTTVGIGVRDPSNPLHEDTISLGTRPPRGCTIYAWAFPKSQLPPNQTWLFGTAATGAAFPPTDANNRVDPFLTSIPAYDFMIQYPYNVITQEYTFHQTIAPMAVVCMYLDAYGANHFFPPTKDFILSGTVPTVYSKPIVLTLPGANIGLTSVAPIVAVIDVTAPTVPTGLTGTPLSD